MPRLSKLLEKLEDTVEARWGVWFQRHKKMLPLYIPVGLVCWYLRNAPELHASRH